MPMKICRQLVHKYKLLHVYTDIRQYVPLFLVFIRWPDNVGFSPFWLIQVNWKQQWKIKKVFNDVLTSLDHN